MNDTAHVREVRPFGEHHAIHDRVEPALAHREQHAPPFVLRCEPADRCRPVFDRTYWTEYKGGGTDAAAWAYLRASEAAEACQRGK